MRLRRVVLVLLGIAAAIGLARRRRPSKFVDVRFEDGSTIRVSRGPEAKDLLDDAEQIIEVIS